MNITVRELSTLQRINRILIGAVMIITTMVLPVAPLGYLALLPLVATYPVFAGMFGYDPLMSYLEHQSSKAIHRVADYHGSHTPHHR